MARFLTQGPVPFAYRAGNSPLHRAPAGLKLLVLLLLSIAAFSSIPGLLLSVLCIVVFSPLARIRPIGLLWGCRSILFLTLFIFAFTAFRPGASLSLGAMSIFGLEIPAFTVPGINAGSLFEGFLAALRIITAFTAGSLLFAVTTMRELRLSLEKAEQIITGFLRKKTSPHSSLSLSVSLMLGFIPRFFELWETVNLACEARLGKRGFKRLLVSIPLVCERMMEAAADTAEALEARGLIL